MRVCKALALAKTLRPYPSAFGRLKEPYFIMFECVQYSCQRSAVMRHA